MKSLAAAFLLLVPALSPAAAQTVPARIDWTKPVVGVDDTLKASKQVEAEAIAVELLDGEAAADAPLPPPCEAPMPRSPAQPPGPPAPPPAPCRP